MGVRFCLVGRRPARERGAKEGTPLRATEDRITPYNGDGELVLVSAKARECDREERDAAGAMSGRDRLRAAHPDSSLSVAEQALDLVVFVGARDKHLYLERGQVKDLSLHDLLGAHKRRDSQNPPD